MINVLFTLDHSEPDSNFCNYYNLNCELVP